MNRLLKPFVPLVGAAALIAAPVAFAAPAFAAVIEPDDSIPFDPELLDPTVWEDILAEEEDVDAWCESFGDIRTPLYIPDVIDAFQLPEDAEPADFGYYLAVLAGFPEEGTEEDPDLELYWEPSVGDEIEHAAGQNLEVILCVAEYEDEVSPSPSPTVSTKPSVKPTVTGPVVETDRVGDSASVPGLGLAAAGTALVAGAGALVLSRRRQGSHR